MRLAIAQHTTKTGRPPANLVGHLSIVHVIVVALSLCLTMGALFYSKIQLDTRVEARFEVARDQTVQLINNGMQKYEDALWAGVSALNSHENAMSLEQWRAFSRLLRIEERYPGINGIGVIHFVPPEDLPGFLRDRRAERPDFRIFPTHDYPISMPISFIEPEDINAQAIGLDVAHEVNRRTAALASRNTGTAQISGPITLVQDADATPGFLFFAPFYETDRPPAAHQPEDHAVGAVYAPFVVRKLMEGLLAKDQRNLRFSITDAGQVIYDEHSMADPTLDPNPMFTEQLSLDLYGRTWTLNIHTNLAFRAGNTYPEPMLVLIGGLIIEILVISMLVMMARANGRTMAYADRVTADLRAEKHKLAVTNEELEQFAYVASHDLKTPIRGISGLTDMLREDLEDYLKSPDADPEVAHNLDRIDARVTRMTELTRGILEFSRVVSSTQPTAPLDLAATVKTFLADFDLDEDQITCDSDVGAISADSFNLRRVLENLVGNAVKYHDGGQRLHIDIRVKRIAERLRIEVSDNGPGIDPQFHQRVFEVFQTLRQADAPESTGIGLAIVKKLVERQGGAIVLKSEVGAGATFCFDWPAQDDNVTQSQLEKAA